MQIGNKAHIQHTANLGGVGKVSEQHTKRLLPDGYAQRLGNIRQMPRLSEAMTAKILGSIAANRAKAPDPELKAEGASNKKQDPKTSSSAQTYKKVEGELFGAGGPKLSDVKQGGLADCYFLASVGAVAADNPQAIQDAIKSNVDGTYSVRFHKPGGDVVWVNVDGDLPVDSNGKLAYAKGVDSDGDGKLELWVPIMEKAYAKFKDQHGPKDGVHGYNDLNQGGSAKDAISALTGKASRYETVPKSDSDFEDLLASANDGAEVVVGTKNDADEGWVGWHAYTVVGTFEENGETMVTLRNPWGSTEPANADKGVNTNDGVFSVPMDDLRGQIKGVHTNAEKASFNLLDWLNPFN